MSKVDIGKSIIDKYTRLTEKLREHGVDFVLTLADAERKKKARSKGRTHKGGIFTSVDHAPTQYYTLCLKSKGNASKLSSFKHASMVAEVNDVASSCGSASVGKRSIDMLPGMKRYRRDL